MKEHTSNFETEIKTYGRQQAVQVIFEQDGQQVVLDNENVFSVTPNFKASLLKSAMKSLILDCNVEIPVGTRLQFKYGILVNNAYEYLNFGYYIVNKIEKKEDTRSYEITCYDKMMLTMVDYIDLEISYPITIRNYIAKICNHLEIDFGSNQDQFVNYDKQIPSELYLDENGNSLDYTFRDVLDELSQVTASIICIDENDQLVVKYPQRNGDYETIEGTSLYIENADDSKIDLELKGNTTQNGTPTPDAPVAINNVTGLQNFSICGKNLYDKNNVTSTGASNQNIKFTTTLLPNTQYTFNITSNRTWGTIYLYDSSNTQTRTIGNYSDANKLTFTTSASEVKGDFIFKADTNVDVSTYDFTGVQLEKGTATTYEPYQGRDYEINLGKNLVEPKMATTTQNGITCTNNGDGSFTLNGTATASTSFRLDQTTYNARDNLKSYNGTYTLSCSEIENGLDLRVMQNSTWVSLLKMINSNTPVTATVDKDNCFIYINVENGKSVNNLTIRPMLEKSSVATSYAPYFTPIELNKIGNYQDFIRKGTGKNLFNKNAQPYKNNRYIDGSGQEGSSTEFSIFKTYLEPNTTYTITNSGGSGTPGYVLFNSSGVRVGGSNYSNTSHITFTTTSDTSYILESVVTDTSSTRYDLNIYQIEPGSIATSYEPYNYGDKWYIEKNIGKIIVNGSENCSRQVLSNDIVRFMFTGNVDGIGGARQTIFSNYFVANLNSANDREGIGFVYGNLLYLYKQEASVTNFQSWLNTHNTSVYYVLNTPTYTLIDNKELIEQLERVHLEQGLNNISVVTNNNQPVLKISYVSNLIGIDEEQLKDINVNFGEKYGPINSVVIARAADSDFIFKEDDQSVAENGLCEVKISDNQILNDDNRTQFLDGIYYQLKGTEFYLNDFSSTGIVYLDLLDYYKVKVFDNYYKCLMLNDEIDITQGLQEQVFTERPKESETEYKSIAKQDKDIRKIGIIVNKVEGEITAEIIARQDTDEKVSNLTQTIGEISTTVSTTTTQVEDLETRVYTNETSISQNADSITATISRIQQTEDDVETLQTNTEDVVKQLVFGDDGLTISAKGTTSDDMKLNLTNDAIKFLYHNNAILTINGSVIEFSNASFKKLDLGNYVWQAEDDDSLSLIYEGE